MAIGSRRWSTARAVFQLAAWSLFIALIVSLRDPVEHAAFFDLVPRLSAHLGIATSLAMRQVATAFYPALVVLGLTVALGRFFCGWLCPMGATVDAADRAVRPDGRNELRRGERTVAIKPFKYAVLAISLALALAGANVAGLVDPLSLAVRSYGTAVYSYADYLAKAVFDGLYSVPLLGMISEPVYGALKSFLLDANPVTYYHHAAVFVFFIAVLALSRLARRFWCQSLCPFGAVLALASRWGFLRRIVDAEKCASCRRCERACRMNAIADAGRTTREDECVKCFECLQSCRDGAISFRFTTPFSRHAASAAPAGGGVRTRRHFLIGLASSAVLLPLVRQNAEARKDFTAIIRPPGALPEPSFIAACVRCGACLKACPTNALHPAFAEAGIEGMFTPRLIPRIGYCEQSCTLCTRICPSGAIRELDAAAKERFVIGTAVIDRDLCIPWSEGSDCVVCEEMCPVADKAIRLKRTRMVNDEGKRVTVSLPVVLEDLCIGCGACENKCPVSGGSAITVRSPKKSLAAKE